MGTNKQLETIQKMGQIIKFLLRELRNLAFDFRDNGVLLNRIDEISQKADHMLDDALKDYL